MCVQRVGWRYSILLIQATTIFWDPAVCHPTTTNVAAEIRRRFFDTTQISVDGPTARLCTLSQSAVLGDMVNKLINGDFNEDEWLHMLRVCGIERAKNVATIMRAHMLLIEVVQ